jgi:hypothetical protein
VGMTESKLYLYACSFGKFGTPKGPNAHIWNDEHSFGDVLSRKLNLTLVNRSWPGGANHHIFLRIMRDVFSNNIKEQDFVIVQYSFIDRAWCNDLSKTVMPYHKEFEDYYKLYYSDKMSLLNLVSFNEYLKTKIKCKFVYSFVDKSETLKNTTVHLYNDFINDHRFFSINGEGPITYLSSLNDKKLFFPLDIHPSADGHKIIADLYYDFIRKNHS